MLDVFFSLRCPDCGGKIKEEERYCPHCGVDLDAPIAPTERGPGDNENSPARQHFKAAQKGYEITTEAGLRDALINCDLALQYDPNFADAHNLRGLALDEMGRIEEAIAAYRKALRLNPDLGEARINLEDAEAELANQSVPELVNQSIGFIEEGEPRSSGSGKYIMWILAALMVSYALLFGFTQIQKFANAYLLPKTTVVFISDVPDGVTVEQADLEKAAQVLSERSERLGYSNVTFEVSTAGEIVGMIPVTVDAVKFAEQVGDVGILEFVDFGDSPVLAGDIVRTDLDSKYLPQVDGQEWHTVMSNEGILAAEAHRAQIGNEFQIGFALTTEGTQIFLDYTSKNVGKFLGIVLDKVVISVPRINQPITDGQGLISGAFTEKEAQELAVILQTKPLPFPVRLR